MAFGFSAKTIYFNFCTQPNWSWVVKTTKPTRKLFGVEVGKITYKQKGNLTFSTVVMLFPV